MSANAGTTATTAAGGSYELHRDLLGTGWGEAKYDWWPIS